MSHRPPNDQTASLKHERRLWAEGYRLIGGIDEVGRGPWAGPLVAGLVVLPLENLLLSQVLQGVRDSKQMSAAQRERAADKIKDQATTWGIGVVHAAELDALHQMNDATLLAYQRAYDMATRPPAPPQLDVLLIDYLRWPHSPAPHQAILHGDRESLSIAAASIIAKVWRDAYMREQAHAAHPRYGFDQHKGYGTAQHRAALEAYGPCSEHRHHYKPVIAAQQQRFFGDL